MKRTITLVSFFIYGRNFICWGLIQGYLVGNPVTDAQFDSGAFVPYAYRMGLISDELYKVM